MTSKKREAFENDYPPVVTEKLRKQGRIAPTPPAKKSDILRKGIACIVFALLLALLMRCVNGITGFWKGTLTVLALWLVVNGYDFLVIDVLMAPFDPFYRAAGVSALDPSAVWFHFKGSLKGVLLGLVIAPAAGLLVTLL